MLRFIDDNDFLLVDKYKQNDDGTVTWSMIKGADHFSGIIYDGLVRVDGNGVNIDVWQKLQSMVAQQVVTIDTAHLLIERKEASKAIINAKRDSLNNADIDYNGYTFQAGEQSKNDIMGAVVTGTDTIWLTRDNQEIEMSAEDMRGLGIAIANRKKFLVYKARHFKDALDELSDEASIKAFIKNLDWSA